MCAYVSSLKHLSWSFGFLAIHFTHSTEQCSDEARSQYEHHCGGLNGVDETACNDSHICRI